jgi:predicted nucleic-acid-binding protein
LTNDNIEMADIAENILMNEVVFISHEVFAEVIYVLMGVYSISKIEISDMLVKLISFENIHTLNDNITIASLKIFKEKNIDFVDCLLCAYSNNDTIKTFDKKLLKCIES